MSIPADDDQATTSARRSSARRSPAPVTLHIVVDATTTPIHAVHVVAGDSRRRRPEAAQIVPRLPTSTTVEAGPRNQRQRFRQLDGSLEIAEQITTGKLGQEAQETGSALPSGARRRPAWSAPPTTSRALGNGKIKQIEANLNFDMVGSPNFVRFVYDGDISDSAPPPGRCAPGSGNRGGLQRLLPLSRAWPRSDRFDGRSDYGPFIAIGIPAGGLFTGAEGIKTPEQAEVYGGTAAPVRPVLPPGVRHARGR